MSFIWPEDTFAIKTLHKEKLTLPVAFLFLGTAPIVRPKPLKICILIEVKIAMMVLLLRWWEYLLLRCLCLLWLGWLRCMLRDQLRSLGEPMEVWHL